jgi:hypothetical protein
MAHVMDYECCCPSCIEERNRQRQQKTLAGKMFLDEPGDLQFLDEPGDLQGDFIQSWEERQLKIYGYVLCPCGSGLYTEECCG